jgi:hypothetical protein
MATTNFEPVITYNETTWQVSDLLYLAYRLAGQLKIAGQGISQSEANEALAILNHMINGWAAEALFVIYWRRSIQNMVANQGSYGVGPGQDFDMERPPKIPRAGFIVPSNTVPSQTAEIPMRIITAMEEWAQFIVKQVQSTLPLAMYYQPAVPYGCARFWPVPSIASQIAIYTPVRLSEFQTVDDQVITPEGFREGLLYNLAMRIHQLNPSKTMDSSVAEYAQDYKQRIKYMLVQPMYIGSDPATMQEGRRDWPYGGNPRSWTPY